MKKDLTSLSKEQYISLVQKIYARFMLSDDVDFLFMVYCIEEAQKIVDEWLKENNIKTDF